MVDATNGFDAASADAGGANGASVVPAPADLIALTKRLHKLGAEQATIEKLAAKFGVKQATLEGWARRERPFGPEHADIAVGVEAALQGWIVRLEAEREEAAQDRPNGAGQKAQGSPEPGDADAAWEKMQREQRRQQDGRTARDDPIALQERFDEALKRLERATPRPAALSCGLIAADDGVLDFDEDYRGPMALQPRISDRLTRGEVHMLVADPNVGKTTLTYLLALSSAEANAALIGQSKIDWCGPALVVSNEDVSSNGAARWREQRQRLGLTGRLQHKLSIWPKRLTLARFEDNVLTPTAAGCEFVETLADRAEQGLCYAYIILDPLTGLFPGVSENDSPQMGDVVTLCKRIAEASFAAVDIVHHTSKSTRGEETVTAYRGATGSEGAVDEISTFAVLLPAELAALGFPASTRPRSIVRLMGQRKRNGPFGGTYYFEREILHVPAVDPRKPGELAAEPGTVAVMTVIPLPTKSGLGANDVQRWLWEANQGVGERRLTRGQRMAGRAGAAVLHVMEKGGCDRKTAETLIDKLIDDGRARLENVWIGTNNRPVVITEPPPPEATEEGAAY